MIKLHRKVLVGALVGAAIGVMQNGVMVVQADKVEKSPTGCN